MAKGRFQPGFRLSAFDVLILIVGAAASAYAYSIDRPLGIAIAFVVLHFFLFCNVLRMSRDLELIWAGAFAVLAVAANAFGAITWPVVFGSSLAVTLCLVAALLRRPSYHGVGWRTVNPRLPEWWAARTGNAADRRDVE